MRRYVQGEFEALLRGREIVNKASGRSEVAGRQFDPDSDIGAEEVQPGFHR